MVAPRACRCANVHASALDCRNLHAAAHLDSTPDLSGARAPAPEAEVHNVSAGTAVFCAGPIKLASFALLAGTLHRILSLKIIFTLINLLAVKFNGVVFHLTRKLKLNKDLK